MYPHWTENDLLVDGIKMHYTRTGDGSKPPLVLAHGFSDNGKCWLLAARELEFDYDVILPDARGHGLSERVQPGGAVDMVADLAGFVRGLGLTRPVIGGHSMGAEVSVQVEARFPGLVKALILEDPGWWAPQPPKEETETEKQPRSNPFLDWLMSLEKLSLEELIVKCRSDSPTWDEEELHPWAESKKQFDYNFLKRQEPVQIDWQEVVKAIQCPALLLTADTAKGAIVTPELAQEASEMNAQIRVVNVSGAGHNIRREKFPEFMIAIGKFLKAIGQ